MRTPPSRCLAPSILSADFAALGEAVRRIEPHAGLLHVDVMDGHFVPNITLGPPVVERLRSATELPIDCHLMIDEPDRYLGAFASAGTDLLSVHQEACPHLHRTVQAIRELGMSPGVALNPSTPVETLSVVLPDLDFVLIMSVNPGFGGQKFIHSALEKVRRLASLRRERALTFAIEVDGGVGPTTLPPLLEAGADWLVAGSAVFGVADPAESARALTETILGAP
ncbi:MAG: ribulose-phosphate 3-epimerase [Acidobacteriota bacterium]